MLSGPASDSHRKRGRFFMVCSGPIHRPRERQRARPSPEQTRWAEPRGCAHESGCAHARDGAMNRATTVSAGLSASRKGPIHRPRERQRASPLERTRWAEPRGCIHARAGAMNRAPTVSSVRSANRKGQLHRHKKSAPNPDNYRGQRRLLSTKNSDPTGSLRTVLPWRNATRWGRGRQDQHSL